MCWELQKNVWCNNLKSYPFTLVINSQWNHRKKFNQEMFVFCLSIFPSYTFHQFIVSYLFNYVLNKTVNAWKPDGHVLQMFLYNCFFFSSTGLRLIFFSKHNSNIFLPRLWHFGCWMNFLYFLLYWHLLSPISQPFIQFGLILKVIKCIEFQFIFFKWMSWMINQRELIGQKINVLFCLVHHVQGCLCNIYG